MNSADFLSVLGSRFNQNAARHAGLAWATVEAELVAAPGVMATLQRMEDTGGEPDLIWLPGHRLHGCWVDCSAESPTGRRSLCYDGEARTSRKEFAPADSAMELAQNMGVELLDEADYFAFQEFGPFDRKTSSWLLTLQEVRKKGGAIFGDYRYGRTFIYHNGVQSYYAARGFRAKLSTGWNC